MGICLHLQLMQIARANEQLDVVGEREEDCKNKDNLIVCVRVHVCVLLVAALVPR